LTIEATNEIDVESLKNLCRDMAASRLKSHAYIDEVKIEQVNTELKLDSVGQWLSLIFVSAHAVKINFRAHFQFKEAKQLALSAYGLKEDDDIDLLKVEDFVKEYCNLTAGAIKQKLEESGLQSLISLPLLTRGSDDVFFESHPDNKESTLIFRDKWKLCHGDSFLICSIFFEIYDKGALRDIMLNAFGTEEDDGDIDFF
jgi:CheY-specific phosphatase CheX